MKSSSSATVKAFVMSGLVFALAACGGGGDGDAAPAPDPATSAEGLWIGSTSSSRTLTAFVLDDGSYWLLYSLPHASSFIAGFVQGSGSALNGSFSSSDGVDFNIEGQGVNNATVSVSYRVRQSFNGSVSYPSLNQSYTFTSSYNPDYEQTPSVSAISGTYTGVASVAGKDELSSIVISAPGVVAGTALGSGCKFLGTARPRSKGNLYDVSVKFGGGACASGTSTVAGIGYFDSGAKRLYLAALNDTRSNGLIFVGIKP
ncbi:MAG: hypothetical protein IH604_12900 [Burkholderiales bacterium]|nr:hypothetical protein [Burkholderiales bacterium]